MQFGWPGLSRAIALSVVLTSAFWVALGAWLFHAHVSADHRLSGGLAAGGAKVEPTPRRLGLLSGLTGGSREDTATVAAPPVRSGKLLIPVAGIEPAGLTDTFSQGRAEGARVHDAIDIMAPEGAPVIAAAPGRVEKLFLSEEGGNTIYVRSPDRRLIYYYAHLSAYDPGLREGAPVRQGQRLGNVGHTGNASAEGPHLHFAVWRADPAKGWYQQAPAINPYPLLARPSRP